jgi:hypothetical protein
VDLAPAVQLMKVSMLIPNVRIHMTKTDYNHLVRTSGGVIAVIDLCLYSTTFEYK